MESSLTPPPPPPKFRFRDNSEPESQNSSELGSDVVSAMSPSIRHPDADLEIESMTGRGIMHLCDELRELKEAANEDLQKNIFSKYSTFLRILEEVIGVENELVQLENHFLSHKRQVKDLIDRIYPKILSIDITFEDHINFVPSPPTELEAHMNECFENLDILISENKIDEALNLLESADEHCQSLQLQHCSHSEIILYESAISEKKSMLVQQLTQIVENKRTPGPDLQRALARLCRLGDIQLAVNLLLKHYRLRVANGTDNLRWAKSSSIEIYMRELARFVFSVISQAARSFVMLCGETSPYASELMLFAYEETKSFIICFDKYVKGTSAISGGLSSAIKAVNFSVMYCSLLENQKLVLRPYLVKNLFPCMEEVLNTHINHFKKVISIFSASDAWILEKYLVSGVFVGAGSSSLAVGEQHDYCLLTTSGRKVLTLLQVIVEDISPLVSLQMGSLVISGITNLLAEYIVILERALTYETSSTEQGSPRIKLAESLPQQVSILANLSTLVQFLTIMVKNIFSSSDHIELQVLENHSIVHQQQGLDDFLLFIEEGSNKLRNMFCQQLILRELSTYHRHEMFSASHCNDQFDANTVPHPMPSGIFQVLFLELRKIEQLEEENVFEVNWLMGLLRELMESMFIWVSNNKEILATTEENVSSKTDEAKQQFILDVQFLVEIGMYGGYFSSDPLLLLTLMKSTFNSAGLDPFKDVDDDDWAIDAATKTIQKLLEFEKTSLHPKEPAVTIKEESHEHESQINQLAYESNFSEEDDISSSENNVVDTSLDAEKDEVAKHELEVAIDAKMASLDTVFSPGEGSLVERDYYVDSNTSNLIPTSIITFQLEDADFEEAADTKNDELTPTSSVGEVGLNSEEETKSKSDEWPTLI
ncbi:Exocyst complex component EXO84A [Glycine soja]|uniref:Exocyst component Exo84 C-terminal domain-containing protein n=2 Tax=Glycine subgen. Soja TaxID=1462606 RepID=A0A0R0HP44_SOYBN|nr:Exocyst complex component EXO84A [Glycine soja]